jgi:hypothetical protein
MPTSNQTLQKLLVGNLRFEHGETVAQRQAIAQKQAPNTLSSPFGGWPGSMP